MEWMRVGRAVRAARTRRGLRQIDVAARAHVSQPTVSNIERGELGRLMLDTISAVARAVGVEVALVARYRGGELDRLLDERHAAVVAAAVEVLRAYGWQVLVEYSFNHWGERGAVDILAWHPGHRALLIVEVKTEIADIQDLLATQDRKARIVPELVARERGWRPLAVGRVLVMPESLRLRRTVARHAAIFDAALPDRSREVRRWLRRPVGPLNGVWFLSSIRPGNAGKVSATAARVTRRRTSATQRYPRSPVPD